MGCCACEVLRPSSDDAAVDNTPAVEGLVREDTWSPSSLGLGSRMLHRRVVVVMVPTRSRGRKELGSLVPTTAKSWRSLWSCSSETLCGIGGSGC